MKKSEKRLFLSVTLLSLSFLGCSEDSGVATQPGLSSSVTVIDLSSSSVTTDPLSSAIVDPLSSATVDPLSSTSVDPLSSSSVDPLSSSTLITTSSSSSEGSSVVSSSSVALVPGTYETLTTANAQSGWGSRYWDGCKPHCAWRENVDTTANPFSICKNCNFDNEEIAAFTLSPNVNPNWTGYEGTKNSCDGGVAYACFDMAPIALNDTLAYAFVATSKANASCGQCFQVQFDGGAKYGVKEAHGLLKGKTLIVMASNTGSDVEAGQFDIMIPGGGVGIYNSFSNQLGVSSATLGEQYGGLLTMCQKEINNYDAPAAEFQTCVTNKCNAIFGSDAKFSDLLRGCLWFADWFEAADNPTYLYRAVECPAYLQNKYPSTINTDKDNTIPASTYQ